MGFCCPEGIKRNKNDKRQTNVLIHCNLITGFKDGTDSVPLIKRLGQQSVPNRAT